MQLITFFLLLLFAFENFLLHRTSAEPCSAALPAAILARHNYYRALHSSTPPLTLNSSLNSQAQQWAEQILATGVFRHRPNRRLSENLFRQISETEVSAKTVVDAWYSESEFYGKFYGREPDLATFSSWRYFTAMIWVSSRELGVGCATKLLENDASNSQSRITYVVTNYSPRGNVVREFAENVRRPRVKTTTTSTTTTAFSTYKSTSKTSYSTSSTTTSKPYKKPSPKPVSMSTKPYTPSSTTAKPPPPPPFYSTAAAAAAATKYRPRSTTKAYQQTTRKTSAIFYGSSSSSSTTAATKTYAKKTTTKAYETTKAAYKTSTTAKIAYKKTTTTTKKPVKYTKYTTKTTATTPVTTITTTTSPPSTAEEYPYHPEALPPSSPYDPLGHPQNPYHHPNPQFSYPLLSNYYRPPLPPPPPPPPPQYPSIFSHEDLMDLHEAVYLQRPRPILRPPVHLNIDDLRDLQNNQVKGSGKNKNKNKNKDKPLFDYDPQNDVYNLVGNHANANPNSTFSAEEYSAAISTNKPVFYLPANYQPALQKPPLPSRPLFPFKPLPLSSFLHLLPNSYQQSPAQNTYQQQPFFRPSFYRPVYRPVTSAQRVIYKHQMQEQQQNQKKKKKVKSVDEADNIKEKVENQNEQQSSIN